MPISQPKLWKKVTGAFDNLFNGLERPIGHNGPATCVRGAVMHARSGRTQSPSWMTCDIAVQRRECHWMGGQHHGVMYAAHNTVSASSRCGSAPFSIADRFRFPLSRTNATLLLTTARRNVFSCRLMDSSLNSESYVRLKNSMFSISKF